MKENIALNFQKNNLLEKSLPNDNEDISQFSDCPDVFCQIILLLSAMERYFLVSPSFEEWHGVSQTGG